MGPNHVGASVCRSDHRFAPRGSLACVRRLVFSFLSHFFFFANRSLAGAKGCAIHPSSPAPASLASFVGAGRTARQGARRFNAHRAECDLPRVGRFRCNAPCLPACPRGKQLSENAYKIAYKCVQIHQNSATIQKIRHNIQRILSKIYKKNKKTALKTCHNEYIQIYFVFVKIH